MWVADIFRKNENADDVHCEVIGCGENQLDAGFWVLDHAKPEVQFHDFPPGAKEAREFSAGHVHLLLIN